jgi:hypothetical protein
VQRNQQECESFSNQKIASSVQIYLRKFNLMLWIEFPPLAEFCDRHGIVRAIRGTTIFGRLEFADRLEAIQSILDNSAPTLSWVEVYEQNGRLRHEIARALLCWGIDVEWLVPSQIEQLLFFRGEQVGWLIELSTPKNPAPAGETAQTIAETIAVISTHCQTLSEALELANNMPAELLQDILKAKAEALEPETKQQKQRKQHLKQNFDKMMDMDMPTGEEVEVI